MHPQPLHDPAPASDQALLDVATQLPWGVGLLQKCHRLMQTQDLFSMGQQLMTLLAHYAGITRASLYLRNPHTGQTILHYASGLSDQERAHPVGWASVSEVIAKVLQAGVPFVIADLRQGGPLLPEPVPETDQAKALICVPVEASGRVLGCLTVEYPHALGLSLQQVQRFLSALGNFLGQPTNLYLLEVMQQQRLLHENQQLRTALRGSFQPTNIIGISKSMRAVYRMMEKVTPARTTVLISGETGVGKELVASAIHYNGPLRSGPFVSLNCAALSCDALESELFGHEPGAFQGAHSQRKGCFEQANGGTLFLDEVADLPACVQTKLLRIIQEKSFERLGGKITIQVSVRLIVASSRNLKQCMEAGNFREDLYYRLSVFPIVLPPLRERSADIRALAEHFAARFALAERMEKIVFSQEALFLLEHYHWPGNVRELVHVVEQAVAQVTSGVILPEHLPTSLQPPQHSADVGVPGMLDARLLQAERSILIETLHKARGNTTEAAALLGMTRRMFGVRMARHQLNYRDYRPRATERSTG